MCNNILFILYLITNYWFTKLLFFKTSWKWYATGLICPTHTVPGTTVVCVCDTISATICNIFDNATTTAHRCNHCNKWGGRGGAWYYLNHKVNIAMSLWIDMVEQMVKGSFRWTHRPPKWSMRFVLLLFGPSSLIVLWGASIPHICNFFSTGTIFG